MVGIARGARIDPKVVSESRGLRVTPQIRKSVIAAQQNSGVAERAMMRPPAPTERPRSHTRAGLLRRTPTRQWSHKARRGVRAGPADERAGTAPRVLLSAAGGVNVR